ncbi:ABC transporter ATP-binding protein [Aliarcobacter skirrowii]|uniref:ABC transporter ATP-binding protein n=1 Tax=Aliarcobacter skirrowii TaxID=28200 RepID=UPI0029BAB9E1|nr:ABC transporter ATP-binding protein [Aliarcobacter skirrowii]MDX4026630.1 ABC transporter ATP-binding protein [Aliarcobacter skirrowii]
MNKNTAIKIQNLTKTYKLYDKPIDRLKESLHPLKKKYHKDFYALNDVSFEIKKGETVGIIGKNGSGKSTLLKIITGVLTPTSGRVNVHGKISAILELGAGFNNEMTGIENIYLNTSINGMNKQETNKIIDEIVDFAELGEHIYQPIKTYSSGMKARLAFGVAINVDPEILIVDEALSVGDVRFQQKCLRRMEEFKAQNKTILFVSHSTGMIERFCDRAVWIHEGNIRDIGDSELISKKYYSFMTYGLETTINDSQKSTQEIKKTDSIKWPSLDKCESFGEGGAKIVGVALVDEKNNFLSVLSGGEKVKLLLKIVAYEEIYSPIVGFIIKDKTGVRVTGTNSYITKQTQNIKLIKNQENIVEFEFTMPLVKNGEYTISPALAEGTQDKHIQHHWIHDALLFKILNMDEDARMSWLIRTKDMKIKTIEEL